MWVTTPDGALKLSNRGSAEFRPGGSQNLTISVDPSRSYQTMDGFGASITDSSAHVLYRLDRRNRDATMRRLFSPSDGDGLSFLRQPMGASDFVAGDFYTYDDLPAGKTDYDMRRFSIAHDRAQILPLLRQALELNPRLKVIGSPWSPPAWMKTNGSLIGGRLIDDPRIYAAYARYFVEFVQAYEHAGVPVYAITVQNEPQNRNPSGYPGMDLPVAQEAKLIVAIGRAFRDARIDTKIFGYDHNWSMHPGDIDSTPPGEQPETEYPTDLLSSSAGRFIAGHRLPLLRRRPEPPDRAPPSVPGQGHLVHGVLGLARADRSAGAGLLRHAQVAHPQPRARGHAQLGQDRRQLEPRARSLRRPAPGWVRHLHRRRDGRARADR